MKKALFILTGSTVLAAGAVLSQTMAQTTSAETNPPPAATDTAAVARGAKAWANNCGRCHNLRSPSELNAELWHVSVQHMRVRANLPGSVADDIKAFLISSVTTPEVQYSAQQTGGAAVRSFANLAPGNPAEGEEIYAQTCIACHGADGKGTIEGVPNLTDVKGRLAKSDNILLANIINGYQSEGSLMAMPPMGGNPDMTEQDMADVLAYMRVEYGVKPQPGN